MNINTYSKFTCLIILLLFAGCAGGIQKTYWSAGTGVASAEEKKGNIEQRKSNIQSH